MTDIVTGIGGVSANAESYSTHAYDLFYDPILNDSFGEPIEEEYRPVSQFAGENGVPYQFRIRAEDNVFIRLDTARIEGDAKVVNEDTSDIDDWTLVDVPPAPPPAGGGGNPQGGGGNPQGGGKPPAEGEAKAEAEGEENKKQQLNATCGWSVVNNIYAALFSTISTKVEDTDISDTTTAENLFKSYLINLLSFEREFKNTYFSNPGIRWFADSISGKNRKKIIDRAEFNGENLKKHPFGLRKEDLTEWQPFSIPLLTDLTTTKKMLPPGKTMEITLGRSNPEFYMIQDADTKDKKIVLKNVHLTFEKIPIHDVALAEFQRTIKLKPMKMHFSMNRMKPYTVSRGNTDWGQYEFHHGVLPRAVYICFQDQKTYRGDRTTNPYVFHTPILDQAQLIWDNKSHPNIPWTNRKDRGKKVKLYNDFVRNTGGNVLESTSVPVSYNEYYLNNFILAWDRSKKRDNGFRPQKGEIGRMSINLKVKEAATETMVVIVMMTFDSVLKFEDGTAIVDKL